MPRTDRPSVDHPPEDRVVNDAICDTLPLSQATRSSFVRLMTSKAESKTSWTAPTIRVAARRAATSDCPRGFLAQPVHDREDAEARHERRDEHCHERELHAHGKSAPWNARAKGLAPMISSKPADASWNDAVNMN